MHGGAQDRAHGGARFGGEVGAQRRERLVLGFDDFAAAVQAQDARRAVERAEHHADAAVLAQVGDRLGAAADEVEPGDRLRVEDAEAVLALGRQVDVAVGAGWRGGDEEDLLRGDEVPDAGSDSSQSIKASPSDFNYSSTGVIEPPKRHNDFDFDDVPTADDRGNGKYNGLLVSLNRRMSNHWSLLSNFTWSKCINDGDPGIDITNFYPDPNDPKSNRGPCNSDRRYMYNGSVILQSPGVGSGLARAATEGWQLATIVQARSGASFTPSMTGDLALTGTNNQRPIVTGDPSALSGDQSRLNWFNKAAFVANSPGVWGSATRGMIRGPMYMNVDMSLTRSFKMGATRRLEVRAEAFNVFNRFQLGNPVVNFNATTFGTIITAMPPRVMQFAAKFEF